VICQNLKNDTYTEEQSRVQASRFIFLLYQLFILLFLFCKQAVVIMPFETIKKELNE
jgi:hypothetical protein